VSPRGRIGAPPAGQGAPEIRTKMSGAGPPAPAEPRWDEEVRRATWRTHQSRGGPVDVRFRALRLDGARQSAEPSPHGHDAIFGVGTRTRRAKFCEECAAGPGRAPRRSPTFADLACPGVRTSRVICRAGSGSARLPSLLQAPRREDSRRGRPRRRAQAGDRPVRRPKGSMEPWPTGTPGGGSSRRCRRMMRPSTATRAPSARPGRRQRLFRRARGPRGPRGARLLRGP
jgi:hypothetical protein